VNYSFILVLGFGNELKFKSKRVFKK